jgi:hypothetical protein
MMMRMLERGGLPVMVDHERKPDEDNPNGYYEFEAVKKTKEDASWLADSEGAAVKMVYRLLFDLPTDRSYRVLFMRRKLDEVLESQRVMLSRAGQASDGASDDQIASLFTAELNSFYKWVDQCSHIELIDVDYNRVLSEPRTESERVNEFLGGILDVDAMTHVVDKSLYRNRK